MPFGKFKEKADKLKDISGDIAEASAEKVNQLIDELSQSIPIMKTLGLSIKDFQIGIGAIPEIEAKLTGSIDAINDEEIQKLIGDNQDKKILISILKGLQTASRLKERLGELGFKSVEIDIKLGLPPKISVSLAK